jgi:hypothetical protein
MNPMNDNNIDKDALTSFLVDSLRNYQKLTIDAVLGTKLDIRVFKDALYCTSRACFIHAFAILKQLPQSEQIKILEQINKLTETHIGESKNG